MDLKLNGKAAWITGSSRGIGLAIARRLLEEGCRVALCGRHRADIETARKDFEREFGKGQVLGFEGDVSKPSAAKEMADGCRKSWGGIDLLVLNAGTGRIPGGDMPSEDDWELALRQNLRSATQAARQAMPMLEDTSGCIIAIGSIAGVEDLGAPAAYAAAKAAMHAWLKVLARDAATSKVRVNTVIPGNILFPGGSWDERLRKNRKAVDDYISREVPMARFGKPEEIADAVAFLASPRASFITGASLVVDGGQTRRF